MKLKAFHICKQMLLAAATVGAGGMCLLSSATVQAQAVRPAFPSAFTQVIEQEIERRNMERTLVPVVERYRATDLPSLEALVVDEPAHLYHLFPDTILRPRLTRTWNLYRGENQNFDESFRVDFRLASNLSLETHSRWFDSVITVRPTSGKVSLGIGKKWTEDLSTFGYFDPISQEILGLITQRLNSSSDVSLMAYRDPRRDRTDFLATLKFRF